MTQEERKIYMREYMRKRVAANRDKWNAYHREYRAKNKDSWNAYNNEYQRQYTAKHPEVRMRLVNNTRDSLGSGVYVACLNDRILYVGSTRQLYRRFMDHRKKSIVKNKYQQTLNAFIQAGNEVEFVILENCTNDQLLKREKHYMELLKPEFNKNSIN